MKRIHKAIKNGLFESINSFNLMKPDDNQILSGGFLKLTRSNNTGVKTAAYNFLLGDYVYYDDRLGYNRICGEKVAICVNDDPGKDLYVVLNHPLLSNKFKWANKDTDLYKDIMPDFKDSFKNTRYILENYKDELCGTIWELLGNDEYIPSKDELLTIYNNCKDTKLWDEIGFGQLTYLSSSWYHDAPDRAFYVYFYNGRSSIIKKAGEYYSVALLHID